MEEKKIEIYTIHRGPVTWYDLTPFFKKIENWKWKTVLARTPKENRDDTIFHAIALACFIPYTTGIMNNERIYKEKIVSEMKMDMAQRLGYDSGIGKQFDILNGGFRMPINYEDMYAQFIGNGKPENSTYMLEHISNCIDKDIYLFDHDMKDIWLTGNEEYRIKGRNSIVLYHNKGEYDLIGICKSDDVVFSQFYPESEFIMYIKNRLQKIKNKK